MSRPILLLVLVTSIVLSFGLAAGVQAGSVCDDPCGIPNAAVLAYPTPDVQQLYADDHLLYDRHYDKLVNAVSIYDAPNGSVVDSLDAGFNYVTVKNSVDGWIEIDTGRWVQADNLKEVLPSRYAGVLLSADMPYPIAWILVNVVPSPSPGANAPDDSIPLLRYTVVNIYSTMKVGDWNWYQVGVDQWVEERYVSRV